MNAANKESEMSETLSETFDTAPCPASPESTHRSSIGPGAVPHAMAPRWDIDLPDVKVGTVAIFGRPTLRPPERGWFALHIVASGTLRIEPNGIELSEGQAILLAGDASVTPSAEVPVRMVVIALARSRQGHAKDAVPTACGRQHWTSLRRGIGPLSHLLGLARSARDIAAILKRYPLRHFETAVADTVNSALNEALRAEQLPAPSGTLCRYTRRAMQHMQSDVSAPFDLRALSNIAGCSTRCLHLAFARDIGVTPLNAFRGLKLDAAYRILADGASDSVADVAAKLGFGHCGRFARAFHDRFGLSPSALRHVGEDARPSARGVASFGA
jgi:AraC-like DNA-binding protein